MPTKGNTMKTLIWFSMLSVICISTTSCTAAPVSESPTASIDVPVKRFLHFYFHDYKRGMPGESQLPQLATFVTPELLDLFRAGIKGEGCYAKNQNYEGPPYIEGDLFSSLFEGGTKATYRLVKKEKDKATVVIDWTNDAEYTGGPPFSWKDRVFLARTAKGWLISDFAHDGDWDFMKNGSVAQILTVVANECSP
jgi:hypothetical protein